MNAEFRRRMATPVAVTLFLLCGLGINVLLAGVATFHARGYVEAAVAGTMVVVVLIVSMEVRHDAPLVRLFAGIGFFWLAILFGMTLLDYLTR
jgi:cytochrome c oxidase subunit 4